MSCGGRQTDSRQDGTACRKMGQTHRNPAEQEMGEKEAGREEGGGPGGERTRARTDKAIEE